MAVCVFGIITIHGVSYGNNNGLFILLLFLPACASFARSVCVFLFTWISSISTNYYFSVSAPYQRGCVGFLLCNPQEIVDIFSLSYTVLINLNLFAFNHCVVYNFYVHSTSQHCSKFYRSFAKFLFFFVCKRLNILKQPFHAFRLHQKNNVGFSVDFI